MALGGDAVMTKSTPISRLRFLLLVCPAAIALYASVADTVNGVAPSGAFAVFLFYGILAVAGVCCYRPKCDRKRFPN